jgi:serine/threonine-protein kinase
LVDSREGTEPEPVPDQTTEVSVIESPRVDQATQVSVIERPRPARISNQITGVYDGDDASSTQPPTRLFGGRDIVTRDTQVVNLTEFEIAPGTTLGEYVIQGKLGEGGMGTVFSALHPMIGKRAAIKVLKPQFGGDDATIQRFIEEAKIVNQIGHPNIVDIFAFGEMPDGRRFFVMEWLKGETLRERLRRGKLTLTQMANTIRALARALEAAHDKGVIHRDVKPENIFLADIAHEEPLVKLLDFGVAKLANDKRGLAQTVKGQILGTPMYIAPEQASNANEVGFASDVYSLGAIAFECLTGRPPFLAKNTVEMVTAHITETPVAPSSLCPEVPEEIDTLVLEMLAKNPAHRPSLSHVRKMLELVRDPAELFENPRTITARRPDDPKTDPFGRPLNTPRRDEGFEVRFSSGVHAPLQREAPLAGEDKHAPARSGARASEWVAWIALGAVVAAVITLFATGIFRV